MPRTHDKRLFGSLPRVLFVAGLVLAVGAGMPIKQPFGQAAQENAERIRPLQAQPLHASQLGSGPARPILGELKAETRRWVF